MAVDDNDNVDTTDQEEATPVEQASAQVRTTPFLPTPADTAQADTDQVEAPTPPAARTTPFLPTPEVSARKPFLPTPETPPGWSGPEGAARQQAWQYASAGGGAPRAELVKMPAAPITVAYQQAEAFRRQGELDNLQNALSTSTDPNELYNKLDKPMPGTWDPISQSYLGAVSDPIRTAARDAFKSQIDAASSQVTPGAVAGEFWNQITGNLQDLQLTINKGVANIDQEHIKQFLDTALPGQSDEEKQAFLQQLYQIPREQRAQILDAYIPYTTTGIPSSDPQYIISAMDRLSDPKLQAQQKAQLDQNEAEVKQKLASNPALANTPYPFIARAIGQIPRAGIASLVPPLMYADLFRQVRDNTAQDHPDWSDDQLDEFAAKSATAQLVPQELLGRLIGQSAGPLMRDIKSGLLRGAATAAVHTATGAALGAAGQASSNLATGQSLMQGVGQAAGAGAIMGGVPGVVHAVPEAMRPPEAPPTFETVTQEAVPRPAPEVTTGPKGAPIRGPEESTLERGQAEAEQPPTPPAPEPPPPVDQSTPAVPIMEEPTPEPPQPLTRAETETDDSVLTTPEEHVAGLEQPSTAPEAQKAGQPENEPGLVTPEDILYTASTAIPPEMEDFSKTDSLKEAAQVAADKVTDPVTKEVAQKIATMVPEEAKFGIADFSQPIRANGKEYSGTLSAGLYHPDSQTALVSDRTTNPVAAILHEATHAALNDAITNPKELPAQGQEGITQIQEAYRNALLAAPQRPPTWMGYGLTSPEEFVSAAVSDPRFQRWLASVPVPDGAPGGLWVRALRGAANVLRLPIRAADNIYERTLAGINRLGMPPVQSGMQAPIYAANPFGRIASRGLPRPLVTAERMFRQATMTMRANLDATPETRPLSIAMDRAYDTKDALLGPRLQASKDILRLAKGRSKEVALEFQRMAEQIDNGEPATTTDPVVRQIWDTFTRFKAQDAQFMRDNEFEVQKPDGTWRPFTGVDPDKYIVRSIREDVAEVLRAPRNPDGSYTDDFMKIFNEGLQKGFFDTPNDLEMHVPQVGQGLIQGPRITALESARTLRLPSFLYDYSIDGQLRNLHASTDARARLSAFGQSRPGVPDLFQATIDRINQSRSLTYQQKRIAVLNTQLARDEWYHQNTKGLYNTVGAAIRTGASAIQTGNYYTSLKVGISRLFFSMQNKGLSNTMSALIRTLGDYAGNKDTARDLGVIKDAISYQHEDLFNAPTTYRKFMAISRQVIEAAGHGEINRFANVVDMKASQLWLASNLRAIATNPDSPAARLAKELIARRGVDLARLQAGDIGETRSFLRQWVNETQTSYRLMDMPVWSKTVFGKLFFQYQPWAYNVTRMLFRETINPALAAFNRGDINLGARYFTRLMYFGAAAVGAEEMMKALREWMFGRETTAPTWPEFVNALYNHRGGLAWKLVAQRAVDELVGGTFLGMAGDYARSVLNYATGQQEVAHAWTPNSPPALSVVQSLWGLYNKWNLQGHKLSDKDVSDFLGQMFSGFREAKNIAYSASIGLKQLTGQQLPVPGLSEAMGYRERLFAQAKFRQFTNAYPDFRSAAPAAFEPTHQTPYYSNIEDALYAGNVKRARDLVAQMRKDPGIKTEYLDRSLISSMSHRQPIPGGQAGAAFLKWAKDVLSPEDLQRIEVAQNNFLKNAVAAGIFRPGAIQTHQVGQVKKQSMAVRVFQP